MIWLKGNKENFVPIVCVDPYKKLYFIKLSPKNYTSKDKDDSSNIQYINKIVNNEPTTYDLKQLLIQLQKEYDKDEEVNSFIFEGKNQWFDVQDRIAISHVLNIEKENNKITAIIWFGLEQKEVNIDKMINFLKELEIYAKECNTITHTHLAEIDKLNKREDILAYDITANYPNKLTLEL